MKKALSLILVLCMIFALAACGNKAYPSEGISVIIPKGAGGVTDTAVRALLSHAEEQNSKLKFICENVTGASGMTGLVQGANAKNDGYTLSIIPAELSAMSNISSYNCPVSPKDYRFVSIIVTIPMVLAVRTDSEYADIYDFVDKLTTETKIGNSGTYGMGDLAFTAAADGWGKDYTAVPYADGDAAAITALVADNPEVDAVVVCPSSTLDAQVAAGVVKVITSFGTDTCYDAPLVSELKSGYNLDIDFTTWVGVAVPDDTSDDIYNYLVDVFAKATQVPAYAETLSGYFMNAASITGADAESYVYNQYEFFGQLLDSMGVD